jgi:hypothetical protein
MVVLIRTSALAVPGLECSPPDCCMDSSLTSCKFFPPNLPLSKVELATLIKPPTQHSLTSSHSPLSPGTVFLFSRRPASFVVLLS